jgi:16S rRNA (guanine(966)-N(2))-methyltransferase RsmD
MAARQGLRTGTGDPRGARSAPAGRQVASPAGHSAPHEVRLIGGQWKRSRLPVAERPGLRPTPDRVRETLFNWLGQDLGGWHCLDAFAGSGALGFEAASRGAARVLMVERDSRLVQSLQAVRARLGAAQVEIVCDDAMRVLTRRPERHFDLVLLDPPYASGLLPAALQACAEIVGATGWIYAEDAQPLTAPPGWCVHRATRAGAVHAALLRRDAPRPRPDSALTDGGHDEKD